MFTPHCHGVTYQHRHGIGEYYNVINYWHRRRLRRHAACYGAHINGGVTVVGYYDVTTPSGGTLHWYHEQVGRCLHWLLSHNATVVAGHALVISEMV